MVVGDLSTIAGMRAVAEQAEATGRFDAVIHNVGVGYREPRRVETAATGRAGGVRAELFDGTDSVMLVWLGQRRIPGIESGRTLRVHGRLGHLENGSKAIYNPHYEIQK